MLALLWWLFVSHFISFSVLAQKFSNLHTGTKENGVRIPIYRYRHPSPGRRDGRTGSIGLGDFVDVTYNLLMTVGEMEVPIVLDTGSSDLWVISDACKSCSTDIPLYPEASFQSTGLDVQLLYGDSLTGTHAYGSIGTDTVAIASLSLSDQYFAAINDTNTTVLEAGSIGIFGLGFPANSVIWTKIFVHDHSPSPSRRRRSLHSDNHATRFFPHLPKGLVARDSSSGSDSEVTPAILQSYPTTGPFVSRLVTNGVLAAPMFTVALQRDTIDVGGNEGILSLGELPPGVQNSSLVWAPIRGYTPDQGGLAAPPDSPDEVYPISWELFVDDVFLDGVKLPRSNLSSPNISLSALIDTGNSLLRGPSDVIQFINNQLGGSHFPCSTPHTLAFQIGGKLFPVDPRDFVNQAFNNEVADCVANVAPTDAPVEGNGYLYSWSLGAPFLKGVLASFYYGNITYPSRDPPRIGLLSTVPADAGERLEAAIRDAMTAGAGNFVATSDSAPSGVPTAASTNADGVPLAEETITPSSMTGKPNGAASVCRGVSWIWIVLVSCLLSGLRV